jgi:hypothetical protein
VTPEPPAARLGPAGDEDAGRWQQAAQLRVEHPGWIVLWLAYLGQYRAYPLVQDRHRTIVTAAAPGDLAALIRQAEPGGACGPPCGGPAAAGQAARP